MNRQTSPIIMIAVLAASVVSVAGPGWASSPRSDFPGSKTLSGKDFILQGVGRKSMFFKGVFEVGYYQEKRKADLQPLDNVAKHLEVRYFVNIPADKLFNYNISVMEDNYSKDEMLAIADQIAFMKEYYVDLKDGDTYELTYIPEIGTRFEHNGELKGVIKGERFAEILFSVWLGEKPFDRKIKEQILSLRGAAPEEKLTLLGS